MPSAGRRNFSLQLQIVGIYIVTIIKLPWACLCELIYLYGSIRWRSVVSQPDFWHQCQFVSKGQTRGRIPKIWQRNMRTPSVQKHFSGCRAVCCLVSVLVCFSQQTRLWTPLKIVRKLPLFAFLYSLVKCSTDTQHVGLFKWHLKNSYIVCRT